MRATDRPAADGAPGIAGWQRAVFILALGVYLAIAAWLVWRCAVLQPYSDMFDWIVRHDRFRLDGDLGRYLWAPHNYHRIVWTFMVLDLDIRLFGASSWLFIAVGAVCLAATAAMLGRVAAEAAGPGFRLIGGGLAVVLSAMGCHVLDVGSHITTPYLHGLVFAVGAILMGEPRPGAGEPIARRIAALACAVASGLGIAAGLAVWPVLAFGAWRRRDWRWLSIVGAAGVAFSAVYALGQPHGLNPASGGWDIARLKGAAELALNFLGLPWTRGAPHIGWLIGLVMSILAVAALVLRGGVNASREEKIAVQLILFSLGVAAMTAIGRTGVEAPQDVPMRYAVFLIPLHAGLWVLAIPILRRLWMARPQQASPAMAAVSALIVFHQVLMAVFAIRTADANRDLIAAFKAGARTPQMTRIIYPDLDAARVLEARMKREGIYQAEIRPSR